MGKRKDQTFRLAHFSDLHIEDEEGVDVAVESVRHALRRGADHIAIAGDLTALADLKLTRMFLRALANLGLRSASRLSVVPGNHDVFPYSPDSPNQKFSLARPTTCFNQFEKAVTPFAKERLFSNAVLPFGKVIAPGVLLAGLDTTRNECWYPNESAMGELPEEDLNAVAEFFDEHESAVHRIVLMHHYPFNTPPVDLEVLGIKVGEADMDFNEPDAATVRNWLEWAGATLVLCGHVHGDHDRTTKDGVRVLCTGGGYPDSGYYQIDLKPNGKIVVENVGL